MSIYFNPFRKQWLYDFVLAGKRYASYCADPATGKLAKNKKEAKDIETRIRANLLSGQAAARPNPKTYSLAQAFAVHMSMYKEGGQKRNQTLYVKELLAWFGASTPVASISNNRILEYIAWSRNQPLRRWTGGRIKPEGPFPLGRTAANYWKTSESKRSDSTINRYLSALGKALRLAHNDYDQQTGFPLLPVMPKIPKLKEPEILPRPIAPADLEQIIAACPPHLADAIRLTVLMGFRRAEVFSLTIDHFDAHQRGIWLAHSETKANRDEFIPASDMAFAILERLVAQAKEVDQKHLILYRTGGKNIPVTWRPIKNPQTAWENALNKLGLKGRHVFHNTKATFVTAVAQKMPAAVVKDLARHKDFETTMRYIRVADSVRRTGVESVTGQLFLDADKSVQNEKTSRVPNGNPEQKLMKPPEP